MIPGQQLSNLLTKLCGAFIANGSAPGEGASKEDVVDFERRYGVRLPADIYAYYIQVGGMRHGKDYSDDNLISLWRLSEVMPAADETPRNGSWSGGWYIFGDWSLQSHFYLVGLCNDPGIPTPVAISNGPTVAKSFSEFLPGYIHDDQHILY